MNITEYVDYTRKAPYTAANVYIRTNRLIVDANELFYEYVGKKSAMPFESFIHPEDRDEFIETLNNLKGSESEFLSVRLSNLEEAYRFVFMEVCISNKKEDGKQLYQIQFYDLGDITRAYAKYRRNIRKYRQFLMLSNLFMFEYTPDNEIFKIYKSMNDKSIMLVEENLDEWCDSIIDAENVPENVIEGINNLRENLKKGVLSFEIEMEEKDAPGMMCHIKGLPLRYTNGQMMSIGVIQSKIDAKDSFYASASARDGATGLLNKKAIIEYIIARLNRGNIKSKWLIVLDIDNFKDINDKFGHMFGDRVIQRVADTLSEVFGEFGVCGRFGGDEFLIFVEDIETEEAIRSRLKAIAKHMLVAFSDEPENDIQVTLSIGVTNYPKDGDNYQELFSKADKSLYIAKDKGKNRFIIYDEMKHGEYQLQGKKARNVSYAVAGEKRVGMLTNAINSIALDGSKALESGEILNQIIEAYDIDGIAIYADGGNRRINVNGGYAGNPDEDFKAYLETGYCEHYDSNDVYADGALNVMKARCIDAYTALKHMEVGALIHCLTRKDGKPDVLVSFDIFNRSRKWSDTEVEELAIIGKLIAAVISRE